jgi:hypothetical protein
VLCGTTLRYIIYFQKRLLSPFPYVTIFLKYNKLDVAKYYHKRFAETVLLPVIALATYTHIVLCICYEEILTLRMKAMCSTETLLNTYKLHGVTSQKSVNSTGIVSQTGRLVSNVSILLFLILRIVHIFY